SFKPYLDRLQRIFNNQYFLVFQAVPRKKEGLQRVTISTQVANADIASANNVWVPAGGRRLRLRRTRKQLQPGSCRHTAEGVKRCLWSSVSVGFPLEDAGTATCWRSKELRVSTSRRNCSA